MITTTPSSSIVSLEYHYTVQCTRDALPGFLKTSPPLSTKWVSALNALKGRAQTTCAFDGAMVAPLLLRIHSPHFTNRSNMWPANGVKDCCHNVSQISSPSQLTDSLGAGAAAVHPGYRVANLSEFVGRWSCHHRDSTFFSIICAFVGWGTPGGGARKREAWASVHPGGCASRPRASWLCQRLGGCLACRRSPGARRRCLGRRPPGPRFFLGG